VIPLAEIEQLDDDALIAEVHRRILDCQQQARRLRGLHVPDGDAVP
jgi:hypothetical protein